ncbi:MAG TPA: adenosylmethionine decarboxylase [Steroidobacteraceae bacterium]|jgi:S-adenosylmethionine decarboxylase
MSSVVTASGKHLLADFYGVAAAPLKDAAFLERLLREAAQQAGARVLSSHFHVFGDEEGVTGVVLLSESHISIHTWPESGFAALDIFMCGSAHPERALRYATRELRPNGQLVTQTERGKTAKP